MFRRYESDIYTYFLRLTGRPHDAEELAQDTFVRACSAALRFRGASSIRTWLFGIARRVWLEYLRAPRSFPLSGSRDIVEPARDDTEWLDLLQLLGSLQDHDRECIVLVDVLGFEPHAAAQLVGVTPETFRVRLHRARSRFRERHSG